LCFQIFKRFPEWFRILAGTIGWRGDADGIARGQKLRIYHVIFLRVLIISDEMPWGQGIKWASTFSMIRPMPGGGKKLLFVSGSDKHRDGSCSVIRLSFLFT
jgi:hypothetical protein